MAKDNVHNGEDNRTPWQKTRTESYAFMGAEIISEGAWIGAAALIGLIPDKLMNKAADVLSKCIEPVLEPFEKGLSAVCKLKECQPDLSLSRSDRAKQLAKTIMIYTPAVLIGWESKILARRYLNKLNGLNGGPDKWWHMSPSEKMIFLSDEGIHLGSLYVLNNQLSPFTDDMIKTTSDMLHKTTGMSDKKAHEWATASWVWVVPNGIGALGGMLAIAGKHFREWPKGWIGRILGNEPDKGHSH